LILICSHNRRVQKSKPPWRSAQKLVDADQCSLKAAFGIVPIDIELNHPPKTLKSRASNLAINEPKIRFAGGSVYVGDVFLDLSGNALKRRGFLQVSLNDPEATKQHAQSTK